MLFDTEADFPSVSHQEAKDSSNKLHDRVDGILENNRRMASRLSSLELDPNQTIKSAGHETFPRIRSSEIDSVVCDGLQNGLDNTFQDDLQNSRVYTRVAQRISYLSRPWSTGRLLR